MNNTLTVAAAIGVIWATLSPFVIQFCMNVQWAPAAKFSVAAAFGILGGIVSAIVSGAITGLPANPADAIIAAGIILPLAKTAYDDFLKQLGWVKPRLGQPSTN